MQHGPPPSCFAPTGFQLDAVGSATATLSWTSGGATNWQLAYGSQGSAPLSGTVVSASNSPFVLSGLTPSTSYDIYVRDSCAVGDVEQLGGSIEPDDLSAVAAPYLEDFDANFNEGTGPDNNGSTIDTCWSRNPAVGYHWGGGQARHGNGQCRPFCRPYHGQWKVCVRGGEFHHAWIDSRDGKSPRLISAPSRYLSCVFGTICTDPAWAHSSWMCSIAPPGPPMWIRSLQAIREISGLSASSIFLLFPDRRSPALCGQHRCDSHTVGRYRHR